MTIKKKRILKHPLIFILILSISFTMTFGSANASAAEKKDITMADIGWDSIKLGNAVVGMIAENVFDYTWSESSSSTPIAHEAIMKGDLDINLEEWSDQIPTYQKDKKAGKFTELGTNYNDNYQGFYIPSYIAEEYPDIKTVKDLAKHPDLFPDPDDNSKGAIYGGIPGWEITKLMEKKVKAYGLDKYYNYVVPGSQAALDSLITSAYEKKEPIATYYWEPTWLMGKYDMVLLEDDPYNPDTYTDGLGACPAVNVTIGVSNDFAKSNPEFCEFLAKFGLPSALQSECLAYMQDSGASHEETAKWMFAQHPELLKEWLTEEQLAKFEEKTGIEASEKKDYIFSFPFAKNVNTGAIDSAVRKFATKASGPLGAIQGALNKLVKFFTWILSHIPWFILVLAVFVFGWLGRKQLRSGVLYAILLILVGVVGLWEETLITLGIVLASVLIALVLGFPLGILTSRSERANTILRPILDTMQTMPVFVYLIPALLLFGMGNASAVIATVIYAVVPVIRLTSLGIRQVDKEVVEASVAFGATRMQTLIKTQIPQAMPTIMTGVNQTLMMAMSMVVTCSMIGARGLGMEVLEAVNRIEIGRGLLAGGSVVIIAIILDRLTQSLSKDSGSDRQ